MDERRVTSTVTWNVANVRGCLCATYLDLQHLRLSLCTTQVPYALSTSLYAIVIGFRSCQEYAIR